MIKAAFTAVSIFALWLGIQEYAVVKMMSNDSFLAIMRMLFMMIVVYGSSYILFLGGSYFKERYAVAGIRSASYTTQEQYDDMCAQVSEKKTVDQHTLMKSLTNYTSFTFSRVIPADQIDIIIENMQLLADGKDSSNSINHRISGVTSNDLYHFGWNVGKRLKKTNIQIAYFLKETFKTMLDDVSVDTVQTKLANKEGNFTLKLIPLDQELVPHIFPLSA